MKFEIMLGILFDLISKRCVNARYLAEKYEVSVRSIYRYISCLENANVPIYTIRGREGGFAIVDTYKLSSTFMTVEEFNQTISTLSALLENVPNKVLASAVNKLKCSVKHEYSGFNVSGGNLIIDAGPWGDTVGYKSKLAIIEKSIETTTKLFIRYHDRTGQVSERIIEPHVIVFKQGIWYVFAYCNLRKEFRFFKTGRIENATLLKDKFIRQDLSKLQLPLDFWHNSVQAEYIEMQIEKSVLSDVEEWLGIENIETINGKFLAKVSLPYDDGLVYKIMSYGNGIKVLSPKKLKDKIISCAKSIVDKYKN